MKNGLILEGGAMRGLYTAGVLDVMMEHDLNVDGVVGRAMKKRHTQYNQQVRMAERLAQTGKALLIRPSVPITIKRTETDPQKLKAVYELGREDALKRLDEIRSFIQKAKERES